MSASRTRGFRLPAEWESHEACWLAWPSHAGLWERELAPARRAFVELCMAIADPSPATGEPRGERLEVLVLDARSEADARAALAAIPARYHHIPFGDIWLRDTGPSFLVSESETRAACFGFNGWGGKYLFDHDPEVGQRIARAAGVSVRRFPWVLEGGAVEVDGQGTAIATRQCLLNPNRGAGLDDATVERRLRDALSIEKVVWLDRGLVGDHTDGHIDMIARFVAPGRVVCMVPSNADEPNREVLRSAARTLAGCRDARGRALEVIEIPSPDRVFDRTGTPMPASYVNFYVANTTVTVPVYDSSRDEQTLVDLAAVFEDHRAVAVDARSILTGGGAFHCITRQQPLCPGGR